MWWPTLRRCVNRESDRKMMDQPPYTTRRRFLALSGGVAMAGTSRPAAGRGDAGDAEQRRSEPWSSTATVRPGKVKLDIPPLVENGNAVGPLTVSATSPMTADDHVVSIHIFNEKNPQPNIGNFYLGARCRARRGLHPHPARRHPA